MSSSTSEPTGSPQHQIDEHLGRAAIGRLPPLASEWKNVPISRLMVFIEESLRQGTQWAVFEPNAEPLWTQIRNDIEAFMLALFRQGAFQGQAPRDAFFVKIDATTTTQSDIDSGSVNILVGFAPLKPAEFVIFMIQQRTVRAEK